MQFRMDRTLSFWVDCSYEDQRYENSNRTKADLIAEILRDYERHGDAMRYLNAEGKIAWKTSPRPCFGNWSTRSASLRMIGGFFGPQIRSEQFG
jgi:hypothetical protein